MDVRVKFIIWMSILIVVVVLYSIFVYISGTRDPITEDKLPFNPVSISQDSFNPLSDETDPALDELEEEIIATIELTTPSNIEKELAREGIAEEEEDEALYQITLNSGWSDQLHSPFYPKGAHLSPMVVFSHTIPNTLYKVGKPASAGLEIVAETGATKTIIEEMQQYQAIRQIYSYVIGSRFDAPGKDSVIIKVNEANPYITVISMIAPSPDWFVAAQNIPLFENDKWVSLKKIETILYDAGTDNGRAFNSRNSNTNPKENITKYDLELNLPIAYLEIVKL